MITLFIVIGSLFIVSLGFNTTSAQVQDPSKYPNDLYLKKGQTSEKSITNKIEPAVVENGMECFNVTGSIVSGSPTVAFTTGFQTNRVFRDAIPSSCEGKTFPGTLSGTYKYNAFRFLNNDGATRCVTINLNRVDCQDSNNIFNLFTVAYLNCFNPTNIAENYIGDAGSSGYVQSFSFNVPAGAKFVVVIATVYDNSPSCGNYAFTISGLNNCPTVDMNDECAIVPLEHNIIFVADTLNNRIEKSTNDGLTWSLVGYGPGLGVGQFYAPHGVTANAAGSLIFVADTLNNRVQRSTDGGITWQVIAPPGLAVNQVNAPQGLAYDELNNILYIADTANNRILKATSASTTPAFSLFAGAGPGLLVGQVNAPRGIAVDAMGRVYVADTRNNRIQVNTTGMIGGWSIFAGAGPGTVVGKVNSPCAVFVDSQNRVYVADTLNNRIQMNVGGTTAGWSTLMGPGTTVGTVNAPEGVVVAASGNIFIGDTRNNRVQKRPVAGGATTVVCPPGLVVGQTNQPTGLR